MPDPERAVIFIDGNNWYHSLKEANVTDIRRLDYVKIAQKLVGPRTWQETRYYVGQVPQEGNLGSYAGQRSFLDLFKNSSQRHSVHLGRIEYRLVKSDAAHELLQYLALLSEQGTRIDSRVYRELVDLGQRHKQTRVMTEKAVDVMLAIDLVVMAERNQFDTAYLLSADGDLTPAVSAVRAHGKKVFVVSSRRCAELGKVVDSVIPIDAAWFDRCY